jgi:hypothetical protein
MEIGDELTIRILLPPSIYPDKHLCHNTDAAASLEHGGRR